MPQNFARQLFCIIYNICVVRASLSKIMLQHDNQFTVSQKRSYETRVTLRGKTDRNFAASIFLPLKILPIS
jgi:hypothetical protein